MKDKYYYLAGVALAVASTASIVTYAVQKNKNEKSNVGLLIAGIAGLAGSAYLATQPVRDAQKKLTVEDLLDDDDTELMQTNISEIFGNAAESEEGDQTIRQIELDEDATIEDFINE